MALEELGLPVLLSAWKLVTLKELLGLVRTQYPDISNRGDKTCPTLRGFLTSAKCQPLG
jgi:hypothetical protein